MKIAQIAPIVEQIPPRSYGGTERVISALTEELVARGHEVTLFATGNSKTSARLASVVPRGLRDATNDKDIYGFNTPTMQHIGAAYARYREFDIIHDHNPHMSLPTANVVQTPVVLTWHSPYDEVLGRYFRQLNRPYLVSISHSQAALAKDLQFYGTVHNGLPLAHYPFGEKKGEYLIFVGRIDREKGVHLAMDAAIALKKPLIIAAKLDDSVPQIKAYFEEEIAPRLRAHPKMLSWIGEVDEEKRNELMQGALCLLHAVTWPEPFGLTLIEAGACGCPVVAFNKGAIPEIIKNGINGYVVENLGEMIKAVRSIDRINRAACRSHVLEHFSDTRMADGYEAIYRKILAKGYGKAHVYCE
jgi:glycosyltransferase involved in cell wall biosynthesis